MKYKNWKSSLDKWKKILKGAKKGKLFSTMGSCGYCREYYTEYYDEKKDGVHECEECPLFREKFCANDMTIGLKRKTVVWQYFDVFNHLTETSPSILNSTEDCAEPLRLAKIMLERIKKDDPRKRRINKETQK